MPCEIGPYNRILDFGKTHFILERVNDLYATARALYLYTALSHLPLESWVISPSNLHEKAF